MRSKHRSQLVFVSILVLAAAGPAQAISKCKARIDKQDGAIEVSASTVANNPLWGAQPGSEVNSFADIATCFAGGKLKGCRLGAPGSLAEGTPPTGCKIHMVDDGADDCVAIVPGCTVGIRPGQNGVDDGLEVSSESGSAAIRGFNSGQGSGVQGFVPDGGMGSGVSGYNYGTDRYAAEFEIYNPASSRAALYTRTNGTGFAIQAEINSNTTGTALFARTTSNNPASRAASFVGGVDIQGNLTKSSGSFKIDHPLDPANRYLSHSFVESPDMMNVYDGNVALGPDGKATVTMPEWFEALNRDFRYQLTPIGAPAPDLYVAKEIAENRFEIAGGPPGLRVSWMVTGVRQDAWANANRVRVEQEKSLAERGTYIHPELFGKPESLRRPPQQAPPADVAGGP